MYCSLCNEPTRNFFKNDREFVQCVNCNAVLLHSRHFLNPEEEKQRYEKHNNDVTDVHYQKFVSPITKAVAEDFPATAKGLDYGCGTGPVAASELGKKNFNIRLYDPYFRDNKEVLQDTYDFIICCEVMEHFLRPAEEFKRLYELLKPGGRLYCKTSLYSASIDFKNWYYKDDLTHVVLYHEKSLNHIKESLGFAELSFTPDLIVFEK